MDQKGSSVWWEQLNVLQGLFPKLTKNNFLTVVVCHFLYAIALETDETFCLLMSFKGIYWQQMNGEIWRPSDFIPGNGANAH